MTARLNSARLILVWVLLSSMLPTLGIVFLLIVLHVANAIQVFLGILFITCVALWNGLLICITLGLIRAASVGPCGCVILYTCMCLYVLLHVSDVGTIWLLLLKS